MRRTLELQADKLERILGLHQVTARVTGGTVTPRWIRFQVLPAQGTKHSRVTSLREEIAAALNVSGCRISRRGAALAVEIPRDDPRPVRLLPLYEQLVESDDSIPPVTAILGLAEDGTPLMIRLPSPDVAHVLVAGTTGSGKTVLLQTMILSLAMLNHPKDLAFVLIDPKAHAFKPFAKLPHLACPVAVEGDDIAAALDNLVTVMERRGGRSPALVVVIDELADLLLVGGKSVQYALTRLTQRGREAGIHIVAATQKPTAEVVGTLVKANFPVRLVGRVTSIDDARTATGWSGTGAEQLTGRGDFLAVAEGRIIRFQTAHVTLDEIREQVAKITHPPAQISWPATDEPEPDRDEVLARKLIASDFWVGRHDNGNYRRGFSTSACVYLFDKPLAGAYYTRTKGILELAEAIAASTTTTGKPPELEKQVSDHSVGSSSREKTINWVSFNRDIPPIPKLVKTMPSCRSIIAALRSRATTPPRPLDIEPERTLLLGAILGSITGYGIRTLIHLIENLL